MGLAGWGLGHLFLGFSTPVSILLSEQRAFFSLLVPGSQLVVPLRLFSGLHLPQRDGKRATTVETTF